jgi:hypothetical protein
MLDFVKVAIVVAMLVVFAAIGLGCAFNPDWGMSTSHAFSWAAASYGRTGTGCRYQHSA